MKFLPDAVNTLKKLIDDGYLAAFREDEDRGKRVWFSHTWNSFIEYEQVDLVFLNSIIEKHYKNKSDELKANDYYTTDFDERLRELRKKPSKVPATGGISFIERWCPPGNGGASRGLANGVGIEIYQIHRTLKVQHREAKNVRRLIEDKWYKKTDTLSNNLHIIKQLYEEELELQQRVKEVVSKREQLNERLIKKLNEGTRLEEIEFTYEDLLSTNDSN